MTIGGVRRQAFVTTLVDVWPDRLSVYRPTTRLMLDPLTALGLAANILQFIEYTGN